MEKDMKILHEPENQNLLMSDSSFGTYDKWWQMNEISNGFMAGRATASKALWDLSINRTS